MAVVTGIGNGGVRRARGIEMKGKESEEAEHHRVMNPTAVNHHHVDSSDKTITCLSLPVVRNHHQGVENPQDGTTTTDVTIPTHQFLHLKCLFVAEAEDTEAETA